ncbi:MAG: hypothetical protein AAF587_38930 [Bacteroidota bacterium]
MKTSSVSLLISFVSLGLLICFPSSLHSQSIPESTPFFKSLELRLGGGGFFHSSKPEFKNTLQAWEGSQHVGWGIFGELVLNDRFSLSSGYKTSSGSVSTDFLNFAPSLDVYSYQVMDWTFQEWEVPITAKFYLLKGKIKPYVVASFGFNKLTGLNIEGKEVLVTHGDDRESPISRINIPTFVNYSMDAGLGLLWKPHSSIGLVVDARMQDARFTYNINDMIDTDVAEFGLVRPLVRAEVYLSLWTSELED